MSKEKAIHSFRTGIEDLLRQVEQEFQEMHRREPDYDILEHNTRAYFFDHFFGLLGWSRGRLADLREEQRIKAGRTCYMDYVGVNLESELPVLIFEAKSWESPFLRTSKGNWVDETELLQELIRHVTNGGNRESAPSTLDWFDHIFQINKYLIGCEQDHHYPTVAAIGSGQWIVVFQNPRKTFLHKEVSLEDIHILKKEQFAHEDYAKVLIEYLGMCSLTPYVPEYISSDVVSKYLLGKPPKNLTKAQNITYNTVAGSWDPTPQYDVYPAYIIKRADGVTINVIGMASSYRTSFEAVLDEDPTPEVMAHLTDVDTKASQLETYLNSTVPDFPASADNLSTASEWVKRFCIPNKQITDTFTFVTGEGTHIFTPPVNECQYRLWENSNAQDEAIGDAPLKRPSIAPKERSFFLDGTDFHCSNSRMNSHKETKCIIDPLDARLCCMTCVYKDVCWEEADYDYLPCER